MGYLYLALAIIAEVIGTTALQVSNGFTRPGPAIVVILGYGLAFYFLSLVLRFIPMGVTYAIWAGVGIVLIGLVGAFFFQSDARLPGHDRYGIDRRRGAGDQPLFENSRLAIQ